MIRFYKIPEHSLPHMIASGAVTGAFFTERDGVILNVYMSLYTLTGIIRDIELKTFEDPRSRQLELELKDNRDWSVLLSIVNTEIDQVESSCKRVAEQLDSIPRLTEECLTERPTQRLGYIISPDGQFENKSPVILSVSVFRNLFFKAYPHLCNKEAS